VRGSSEPTRVDLARGVYVVGGDSTSLAGIEDAFAGDADDVVAGDGRANRLFGLRGDDTLRGRGGGDFLDDGDGSDLVFGGYGADVIDTVSGLSGRDEVHAGAGADVLSLGAGGDQVWGDAGADRFLISVTGGPGAPLFTIRDFEVVGGDLIDLSFLDVDGAGVKRASSSSASACSRPTGSGKCVSSSAEARRSSGTRIRTRGRRRASR
jgi:Ca2+-binding RTX toxin-like protein